MPSYSGVWSLSQQFQGRGQGLWPQLPGAPTIGTATAGLASCASVPFTAPACAGVPATLTYTATSTPGGITATGASSPVVVTGLTLGTSYTFRVKATNNAGSSACSAASNSVTAKVATCATFTTPGTYSWVAPAGVTSVAVLTVGGGGGGSGGRKVGEYAIGGAGGALAYRNAVAVTPGSSYTVVVGARGTAGAAGVGSGGTGGNGGTGGQSKFCVGGTAQAAANGGTGGYATNSTTSNGGTVVTGTGGTGGNSGNFGYNGSTGAGGAGGYAGAGGRGGNGGTPAGAGVAGTGGAGGGSSGSGTRYWGCGTQESYWGTYCGGGVGLNGQGADGFGGFVFNCGEYGYYGGGGSGGTAPGGIGGGGGAGVGVYYICSGTRYGCAGVAGGPGAVRIVWAGCGRGTPSFPSTNVGPS